MEQDETEATTSVDMAALLADPAGSAAVLDGRYRLDKVLGEGGMAVVHRAQDMLLQRPVAVKLLKEHVAGTAERARFTGEVRTLGALSHAGLVTVLDAGVTARRPYLVMELVEGGTLADVSGPLSLDRTADIGAQVASALAYAHAHGVIHRDVKPANVLLGPSGRVKLADFGIARIVGDTVHHTQTGALIGTVSYLSPEQVEGAELTTALDVYSLGLLLLELITGRRPFPGPSVESALSRLTRPPEMPLDLPAAWWVLLSAMTARNPADRPTASEVSQRLDALRGVAGVPDGPALPGPVAASVPAAPAAAARPQVRVPSRLRGVLVAVAAVILLVATAAAAGGKGVRGDDAGSTPGAADVASHAAGAVQTSGQKKASAVAAGGAKTKAAVDRARQPGAKGQRRGSATDTQRGPEPKSAGGRSHGAKGQDKNKGKNKGKGGGKHGPKQGGKQGGKHGPKHR